jgi:hypothetical protein
MHRLNLRYEYQYNMYRNLRTVYVNDQKDKVYYLQFSMAFIKTLLIIINKQGNNTFRGARGGVVVKALRYKRAGRGFDSRWCHWNFSVT